MDEYCLQFSRANTGTADLRFVQLEKMRGCPVVKVTETVWLRRQVTEVINDACSCTSSAEQW